MKLVWDQIAEKLYETGVEQVALFPMTAEGTYGTGVAWNGVTAFNVNPSGAEPTNLYANNNKYLVLMSKEDIGGTIEAYMYPEEFRPCLGFASPVAGLYVGQQDRRGFGVVAKTRIGNDTEYTKHGYKLHIIYGALASPSEDSNSTVNETPEAKTWSFEYTTTPVAMSGFEPTSYLCVDSTNVDEEKLAALEKIIYGDAEVEATLPTPDVVASTLGLVAA